MAEASRERQEHDELTQQYGSTENHRKKMDLWRKAGHSAAWNSALEANAKKPPEKREPIEDLIYEPGINPPFWANPWLLRYLDLALLGAPEGSKEWANDSDTHRTRAKAPVEVFYQDYTELGWPKSAGTSHRKVTDWEHTEILRRLKSGGLTKPGAEVPTVGKTLAEMIELRIPSPPWIIEGLLREGGAAMVYGPSGIGKTWLTHTLMILAAAGKGAGIHNHLTEQWLVQAGPHDGAKVALIDGEMIEADIAERALALTGALGLKAIGTTQTAEPIDYQQLYLAMLKQDDLSADDASEIIEGMKARERVKDFIAEPDGEAAGEAPDDDRPIVDLTNIVVYPKTAQDHRAEFIDLADPTWKSRLVSFCVSNGIKVVIFDNLSTLNDTLEDENDAANWNALSNLIVALKKEGVATLLVHHANKGNTGFRGSTNIGTTLETIVKLEKADTAGAKEGASFKIKIEKNRAQRVPEIEGKTLKLKDGRWEVDADPIDLATEVVRLIQTLRYKTQAEVGVALGVDQATISRSIKVAEARGLVKKGDLKGKLVEARELAEDMKAPDDDDVNPDDLDF